MKNTFAHLAALCLLLAGATARAQNLSESYHSPKSLYLVNWEITQPTGKFGSDYIDELSLRGVSVEGRYFLRHNVSLGLSFSWNRFVQTHDNASMPINNGTATGPVFRDLSMFAIRGIGHFYLLNGPLRPYVGAGIGGSWDYAYQQTADLSRHQSNFDFIVSPEVGLIYNFPAMGGSLGLNGAIRYTYTTATVGNVKDTEAWAAIIGLTFGY